MKAWIVAVAMIGVMASGTAMAERKIYGYGATSCGKFAAYSKELQEEYMVWFSGFATMASDQTEIDYFEGTDFEGRLLWMQNYCRAHPLDLFKYASVALMNELHNKQM